MQQGEQTTTRAKLPARSFQEPVLTYDYQAGRWSEANEQFSVWMDDPTFQAYIASWYDWKQWLPDCLPAERRAAAMAHCLRVRYWAGCEHNFDPQVHITYH